MRDFTYPLSECAQRLRDLQTSPLMRSSTRDGSRWAEAVEGMSPLMFSLQALLMRHEAYITDSEKERKSMAAQIESLEIDKQVLEKKNASVIEENRNLLDQLEALNDAVTSSDAHVTSLQATLASTQREIQKLTQLAAKTENLERQLLDFEREQATWQSALEGKEQSERSAVRRWQTAERTLSKLQQQIEQIEREAAEEKDRHAEIVERMERRHSVEKELGSAAGRLKGAAALKNGERNGADTGIVSHFVKDILQDNTNLQMGIVELREMLNNSNEEVEQLRNQLSLHQPADDSEEATSSTVTRKDLGAEITRASSQELHVHHHYHAPPSAAKPSPAVRKPKRKKYGAFNSGYFTPPSGASTPRSSFSYGTPTSAATILQQTAASVPQAVSGSKRLSTMSTQSNQTFYSIVTSGPNSPQSTTNRTSSIFDRVFSDAGHESSRPTTPDTEDPGSPTLAPMYSSKRGSGSWSRTYSAPIVQRQHMVSGAARPSLDAIMSIEELPKLEQAQPDDEPIQEEDDHITGGDGDFESPLVAETDDSVISPTSDDYIPEVHQEAYRPALRRAASHESLLSVSGMDIHTLKDRPSQMLMAPFAGRAGTSQAVISGTTAHAARPVAMSRDSATGRSLLSGMAADQRGPAKPTMGKKVGGWLFGKWGSTPAPANAEVSPAAATSGSRPTGPIKTGSGSKPVDSKKSSESKPFDAKKASESKPIDTKKVTEVVSSESKKDPVEKPSSPPKKPVSRPSGINQSGPVQGFLPTVAKAQVAPVMNSLDEEALKSLLADG